MEKALEFFDTWFKSQEKLVENWMTASKVYSTKPDRQGDGFVELYTSWVNEVVGTLGRMQGMSAEVIRDTLLKLTDGSDVYVRFYKLWLPLFEAIQQRVSDPEVYREMLDPVKYKEVVDRIFGFSPDAVSEYLDQVSKLTESTNFLSREFGGPWLKAARDNARLGPELMEGRPEAFLNIFHNLFCAFDNTIGKVFHVPAVGKDREKIELMMRGLDDLTVFLAQNTEYQHRIYIASVKAMETVFESLVQKIKDGEDISTFAEFFDLWIDANEREYYDLFRTEDFSDLQGKLLDTSLKLRKHFHKLMELYLFDFPVALRSEMDDLYKTIYDLRKKVGYLEKRLNGLHEKEAAA